MKKFILLEMLLLSTTEKKAKKIIFNPKRTIILGKNETGKSSLLKSIYSTFGATPAKQNPKWMRVSPVSLIKFKVDDDIYFILKDGKYHAMYDNKENIIDVFDSITNGLGIFLANLFDFKVKLPNQKGELIIPPPAFLFLPYYIDQDASWQGAWKSFSNLSQIKNYKTPIIEYHTGLRPNEFYEITSEINKHQEAIQELEKERNLSKSILDKIKNKLSEIDFSIDLDHFKEEIKGLLIECQKLKNERDLIKNKLVDLYNSKIIIETQITITKQALNEARKDYNYAVLEVENDIDCPTCGAHYENSFLERFEIAQDENRCKDLLINLTRDLNEIEDKINKENEFLNKKSEKLINVEILLENKKGQVKLRDLIEGEGRKELRNIFNERVEHLQKSIFENVYNQSEFKKKLKTLENKKRKDDIKSLYKIHMYKYLKELSVSLSEDDYKDLTKDIKNTGSALPRSLTSYYFSILDVIKKYGSSTFCPIIIDSPNQQAQDFENVPKILNFIKTYQPDNSQLILGLEEDYGIDFECDIIKLDSKHSLLQKNEYDEVYDEVTPFLDKIWSSSKTGRLF